MHSRESACTALGKICDPRGFGPLITAARTPEENVSRVHNHAREAIGNYYALSGSAAEALVKYLKDAGEIDPLISCLAGGKEDVRKAAIGAFEELHDDRAIEALKKVAFGQYTDSELRKIAIELLVNHGVNLSP
jgi:HEAT repeat protein